MRYQATPLYWWPSACQHAGTVISPQWRSSNSGSKNLHSCAVAPMVLRTMSGETSPMPSGSVLKFHVPFNETCFRCRFICPACLVSSFQHGDAAPVQHRFSSF